MALGWDVHDVYDEGLAGARDAAIQAACEAEDRVLLTLDMGFADCGTRAASDSRSPNRRLSLRRW